MKEAVVQMMALSFRMDNGTQNRMFADAGTMELSYKEKQALALRISSKFKYETGGQQEGGVAGNFRYLRITEVIAGS